MLTEQTVFSLYGSRAVCVCRGFLNNAPEQLDAAFALCCGFEVDMIRSTLGGWAQAQCQPGLSICSWSIWGGGGGQSWEPYHRCWGWLETRLRPNRHHRCRSLLSPSRTLNPSGSPVSSALRCSPNLRTPHRLS